MKTIQIVIDETGQIAIEAVGFKGNACVAATAAMEKALGVTKASKKKPEYRTEDKTNISASN